MNRLLKQIAYGFLFLMIFIGLSYGSYLIFFKPTPTCFDGIQNQGEEGIDCGGPCVSCAVKNLSPLVIQDLYLLPVSSDVASLVFSIRNSNLTHGSPVFSYQLKDISSGRIIFEEDSFIYPGQTATIILPALEIISDRLTEISVNLSALSWSPRDDFSPPRLQYRDLNISREEGDIIISGNLINNDLVSFSRVKVGSILRLPNNSIAGASATEVSSINPSSSQPFSIRHPDHPEFSLANIEIIISAKREGPPTEIHSIISPETIITPIIPFSF